MSCDNLEKYPAFTCIGNNKVHILVPRRVVARDMLIWAGFFLLFFVLLELIVLSGGVPWPVLLMPLPALAGAVISLGMWLKWHTTGQIVEIDEINHKLTIAERKANLIPSRRKIPLENIKKFSVAPFVVYRSQSNFGSSSTPHTKGFCVSVVFPQRKLLGFIQKNTPGINIGGYLTREEAVSLRNWLTANAKADRTYHHPTHN